MTRRAPPRPGVDRMVSTSWSGRRWSSPAARQGRALARGLEGRFPLQHHYVSDQNSSSSRCWAYFSLALKHGIYRELGLMSLTAWNRGGADADAPGPREVTDASIAQFCGMALTEHAGPKAQIFVRGLPDPYWFATVRDAFAFAILPEMPKAISAIYVSDMARAKNWEQPEPGMWVEAHQAYFVIGSG